MPTCSHGYSSFCADCYKDSLACDRRWVKEGRAVYAVLPYRSDRDYRIEQAVKTYKSRSAAEKYATTTIYTDNALVVRLVFTKEEATK